MMLMREFGVERNAEPVRETVALVQANCRWEHAGQLFFAGEVEPCINGRTVAIGAYFGVAVDDIVSRLPGEQLADGGWNCEAENGSLRSSFHSTICVLEGLVAFERATGGCRDVVTARRRGEEFLLTRRLFRRQSTGAIADADWLQFSFPTRHPPYGAVRSRIRGEPRCCGHIRLGARAERSTRTCRPAARDQPGITLFCSAITLPRAPRGMKRSGLHEIVRAVRHSDAIMGPVAEYLFTDDLNRK
jgi:hypothetical protein